MKARLNLASRPFRNEALPALLFGGASLLLLAASVEHALVLRRLLAADSSAMERESAALASEEAALRRRAQELRKPPPDAPTRAQWALLKDLVDRRSFGWTDLLSCLEAVQPAGVRLVSIAPSMVRGQIQIDLDAVARRLDEALEFVRTLEDSPEFAEVYPLSVGQRETQDGQGELQVRYRMRYLPPPAGQHRSAAAAAARAPGPGEGEAEADAGEEPAAEEEQQ